MFGLTPLCLKSSTPMFYIQGYDATELVKQYKGPDLHLLIDQGQADNFYTDGQLLPDNLSAACASNSIPITLRIQEVT
mgnify:FL=1